MIKTEELHLQTTEFSAMEDRDNRVLITTKAIEDICEKYAMVPMQAVRETTEELMQELMDKDVLSPQTATSVMRTILNRYAAAMHEDIAQEVFDGMKKFFTEWSNIKE